MTCSSIIPMQRELMKLTLVSTMETSGESRAKRRTESGSSYRALEWAFRRRSADIIGP